MIALTLSTAGTALTVNDTGRSGYVLESFDPGVVSSDVVAAGSRWIDGAAYVSHTRGLVTLEMTIQVWAGSYAAMRAAATVLGSVVASEGLTITETAGGGTVGVYSCLPGSWALGVDPVVAAQGMSRVTVQVPRQP